MTFLEEEVTTCQTAVVLTSCSCLWWCEECNEATSQKPGSQQHERPHSKQRVPQAITLYTLQHVQESNKSRSNSCSLTWTVTKTGHFRQIPVEYSPVSGSTVKVKPWCRYICIQSHHFSVPRFNDSILLVASCAVAPVITTYSPTSFDPKRTSNDPQFLPRWSHSWWVASKLQLSCGR